MADALRRWTLPGPAGGYLIARAGDRPLPDGWSVLPASLARAVVERALASGVSTVYDLFEVAGGTLRAGLSRPALAEHHREIARHLEEAFRDGVLVAYRRQPPAVQIVPQADGPAQAELPPEEPIAEEPDNYVNIQLLGEDGNGVPGVRYRVVLPDESVREGTLDSYGSATVRGKFSGACQVSFPELDADAWEPA